MTRVKFRAALYFPLFTLFFCGPLFGARTNSPSFSELNGVISYGSGLMYSSSFETEANAQELAVSSQGAPSYSGRTGKLSFWPLPAPINDLASVAVSSNSLRLVWTAPPADWSRNTGVALGYILRYTTAAPVISEDNFRAAADVAQNWTPLAVGAGEERIIYNFNPGTTYYFAIEALNDYGLIAEISNPAAALALPPLPPMNLKVVTTGNSVAINWIAPAGYRNRIAFNNRFSPAYPWEIKSYQIFRATAPANANWEFIAEVSSGTGGTDLVGQGLQYYYHVRALNQAGASQPSYARASLSGALYFLAPDNESMLEVPADATGDLFTSSADPLDAYSIEISTHPEELSGRVVKSVEFSAYEGGLRRDDRFKLPKPAALKLHYRKVGAEIVPSVADSARGNRHAVSPQQLGRGGPRQAGVTALPDSKAISLYFYNGTKWIQLYGKVDAAAEKIELSTTLLGRYQIRSTERTGDFMADFSGLSNRLITPNGDGKNDTMIFIFDNPNPVGAAVKGRIYDLKGALVAFMTKGELENSLVWDAKAGGRTVYGGVYIYQIDSNGRVYNGTVAVIK